MCSLNAGRWFPHNGQRYVAGFRFCAGRTAHQRGFVSLRSLMPHIRSPSSKASYPTRGGCSPSSDLARLLSSPIQLASCCVQLADEDTAVPEGAGMSRPTPEVAALIACAHGTESPARTRSPARMYLSAVQTCVGTSPRRRACVPPALCLPHGRGSWRTPCRVRSTCRHRTERSRSRRWFRADRLG
jgi:hypothetical protein